MPAPTPPLTRRWCTWSLVTTLVLVLTSIGLALLVASSFHIGSPAAGAAQPLLSPKASFLLALLFAWTATPIIALIVAVLIEGFNYDVVWTNGITLLILALLGTFVCVLSLGYAAFAICVLVITLGALVIYSLSMVLMVLVSRTSPLLNVPTAPMHDARAVETEASTGSQRSVSDEPPSGSDRRGRGQLHAVKSC